MDSRLAGKYMRSVQCPFRAGTEEILHVNTARKQWAGEVNFYYHHEPHESR